MIMTSTQHWVEQGRSGGSEPSVFDEDRNPGATEDWRRGQELARQDQKLWDLWTRPDPAPSDDNR